MPNIECAGNMIFLAYSNISQNKLVVLTIVILFIAIGSDSRETPNNPLNTESITLVMYCMKLSKHASIKDFHPHS